MTPNIRATISYILFLAIINACNKEDVYRNSNNTSNTPIVLPNSSQPCWTKLYDIDITLDTSFEFIENYHNPWDYGAPDPESSYDLTIIEGIGNIESLGEFRVIIMEYAGTDFNYDAYNYFTISQGTYNSIGIDGSCTTNFKKLIKKGGGSFSGNFNITSGSAYDCDPNLFSNLKPLNVTGTLDVNTRMLTLRIKGQVYLK